MNPALPAPSVPVPDAKEIAAYRLLVESLADKNSAEVFENNKSEHAAVIFDVFLKRSKGEVLIFCNKLCDKVFNTPALVESLLAAVNRKVKVRVVTPVKPVPSTFLTMLLELQKTTDLVSLHDGSSNAGIHGVESNFATMDNTAFRYEPAKGTVKAFACMNNPETNSSLRSLFNRIFEATAPLVVEG